MTIFFTIDDISGRGGTERVVANLANALAPTHSIVIITYHLRFDKVSVNLPQNAKIIILEQLYGDFEPKGTIGKLKLCRYINQIIRANGSEKNVLIANCNAFYPFLRQQRTLYMRLEHTDFKFLHAKYINKKPFLPRIAFFDTLVVLSSKELFLWQKLNKNVRVIPNFLPQIPSLNTTYSQKAVLSVGRLSKEKGFLRLLDIWKILAQNKKFEREFQKWQLIIVGDGVLKKELESKIKALNLQESVILKPFTKQIEKEYLSASIYAMSSHFEGFGMVLAEASSYALPCVAFDIKTGPSDIIENEKSGFLVADNDLQGYADKLMLLMRDENLRENFGTKAKQVVSEKFSKEMVMKEWQGLFDELCGG